MPHNPYGPPGQLEIGGQMTRGTFVLGGHLFAGTVVLGDICPGGTLVQGDNCPRGQMSGVQMSVGHLSEGQMSHHNYFSSLIIFSIDIA